MPSIAIHSVRMARLSSDVWATSNVYPPSLSSRPASFASSIPLGVRSTSVQPVNRFSRFQVLSPCRRSTSFLMQPPFEANSSGKHGHTDLHGHSRTHTDPEASLLSVTVRVSPWLSVCPCILAPHMKALIFEGIRKIACATVPDPTLI